MNLKNYPMIITGVTCLIIGIAIGWVIDNSGAKKTDIKWKFGDNELNLNLEQDLNNVSAMLEKIFSEDFSKRGTVAWLKTHQNLYEPGDVDIASKIAELNYKDPVSVKLRDVSAQRTGPWAYQMDTVKIGVPSKISQPNTGFANVCENGEFFTKHLILYSMDESNSIEVKGTGKYACPKGLTKYPDIQLNAADAERLLGTANFSKYEQGIALIKVE